MLYLHHVGSIQIHIYVNIHMHVNVQSSEEGCVQTQQIDPDSKGRCCKSGVQQQQPQSGVII